LVKLMITETMVKPSSWVTNDIRMEKVRNFYLYKFSETLQNRLDDLNTRLKANQLSDEERAELAGILDLDQIFTFLNAQVIVG
jgi:ABC-type protease/lipase transport system fused ATPase/permease subunit